MVFDEKDIKNALAIKSLQIHNLYMNVKTK